MRLNKLISSVLATGAIILSASAYAQPGEFTSNAEYTNITVQHNNLCRIDSLTLQLFCNSPYTQNTNNEEANAHFVANFKINDSIFYSHVNTLESGIPLEYNSYVEGAIKFYALKRKGLLERILATSKFYFPIFEEVLDRNGLPIEFKYLAVIESALNPNAQSWCGATGLWQFMPYTGKQYDLRIDDMVDDRKDLYRSTQAACEYFKNMYAVYGDWLLTIAAYNCGPGNVNKAIRRSGGSKDFWVLKKYLPRETSAYVPYFVAATYLLNFHEQHGIFPDMEQAMTENLTTISIKKQTAFFSIADLTGVPVETLKALNPSYKRGIVVPDEMLTEKIIIPYEHAMLFAKHEDSIYNQSAIITVNESTVTYYTVKRGDGFYNITSRYGCSIADIKRWNNVSMLHPGQKIKIYTTPVPNGFIKPNETDEANNNR